MTDEELNRRFDELIEHMRDMQTELLKAFLPFREDAAARDHLLEQRQNALEQRQAVLGRRLTEIEKKLLLAPPEEL